MKFYRPIKKISAFQSVYATPEAYNRIIDDEAKTEAAAYNELDITADEYFIKMIAAMFDGETSNRFSPDGNIELVPMPENEKRSKAKDVLQQLKSLILDEVGEGSIGGMSEFDSTLLFKLKDKYYKVYYELLEVRRLLNTGVKPPEIIKMIQEGEVLAV